MSVAAMPHPSSQPVFAAPITPYRPVRPSPLSSSPLRATSPPSPHMAMDLPLMACPPPQPLPLPKMFWCSPPASSPPPLSTATASPSTPHTPDTPGTPSDAHSKTPFRFAARPTKSVPRIPTNRDAAAQSRRSLFLRNVRQRADDHVWKRRDCEQELHKLAWWSMEREIREAREAAANANDMPTDEDADMGQDVDDIGWRRARPHEEHAVYHDHGADEDADALLAEQRALEEEAELAAMAEAAATQEDQHAPLHTHSARRWSALYDDADYDALFAEMLAEDHEDTEMGAT